MLITSFIKEADCGSADEIIRGETPGKRWRSLKPADVSAVLSSSFSLLFSVFLLLVILISSRFGVLRARINCPNVAEKDPSHGAGPLICLSEGEMMRSAGSCDLPTMLLRGTEAANENTEWRAEENIYFTDQTASSRYLPIIIITSTQDCTEKWSVAVFLSCV